MRHRIRWALGWAVDLAVTAAVGMVPVLVGVYLLEKFVSPYELAVIVVGLAMGAGI